MKRIVCFVSIFVFLFTSYSFGQDVAVVYDAKIENGAGLGIAGGVAGAKGLADLIVEKLIDHKVSAEIVDAEALVEYMDNNPNGIFILTQGNTPDTIFQNGISRFGLIISYHKLIHIKVSQHIILIRLRQPFPYVLKKLIFPTISHSYTKLSSQYSGAYPCL